MTIFIAPIGTDTEHIKTWLKEESRNLSTLWLIHSKKGNNDFIKIAKKLSSDLSKSYSNIEIKLKAISDAFTIDPTMDAIYEVITQEELEDVMVNRQDFIINITGGTNIMAAAAMNAATFNQTRAQYVLQPQPKDPKNKKYVQEVPVQSEFKARLGNFQLQVLRAINDSDYFIKNTPKGITPLITSGSIENKDLLKKLGWDVRKKGIKNGKTRLAEIAKALEKSGYIKNVGYTEHYVYKDGKKLPFGSVLDNTMKIHRIKFIENEKTQFSELRLKIEKNKKETRFEITALGMRISKNKYLKNK